MANTSGAGRSNTLGCTSWERNRAYLEGVGLLRGKANVAEAEGVDATDGTGEVVSTGPGLDVAPAVGEVDGDGVGVGVGGGGIIFSQWCSGTVELPISSTSFWQRA